MKKVGILTFHYADNYGAVLQTYALKRAIDSLDGFEAEIINYVPENYFFRLYEKGDDAKRLFMNRRRKFESFLENKCGIHTQMITIVEGSGYDYYCVGSDQVWNTELRENVRLEYFFPHLDLQAKRFAYAASIGMEMSKIDDAVYREHISKFKAISLREKEYLSYVDQFVDFECEHVVDPTLLLDVEEYSCIACKGQVEKKIKKPYVLFFWYFLDDEWMKSVEFVNVISRKYDLEVIHSIPNAPKYMFCNDSHFMMYEGIEEFLSLVKNADFVVTNSYHGSIFAMQFEKPFYMFISKRRRNRLDNLVEQFDVGDRVVEGYLSMDKINKNVDYSKIKKLIEKRRNESIGFLKRALNCECK